MPLGNQFEHFGLYDKKVKLMILDDFGDSVEKLSDCFSDSAIHNCESSLYTYVVHLYCPCNPHIVYRT